MRFVSSTLLLELFLVLLVFILLSVSSLVKVAPLISFTFYQELLQLGAEAITPSAPLLSVDDLADQIAEVLDYFG